MATLGKSARSLAVVNLSHVQFAFKWLSLPLHSSHTTDFHRSQQLDQKLKGYIDEIITAMTATLRGISAARQHTCFIAETI